MSSGNLDDIRELDDPASIGRTLLLMTLLITSYSLSVVIQAWLDRGMMQHRVLNWINRHKWLLSFACSLSLLALGMTGMKLSLQLYQLISHQVHIRFELLMAGMFFALAGLLLVELRYRQRWIHWLQHTSTTKESKTSSAMTWGAPQAGDGIVRDKIAREVMTPRIDMICLEHQQVFEQNIELAVRHMRTRYPVVNEDKDDIIGFMHIKDLLAIYEDEQARNEWQKWIRPIITVPESIEISQLLSMMQKQKTQIALLIDEYGGTSGMVTMEDIIEEIVGDIQDEFDQEELRIVKLKTDEFQLSAMLLIEEVNSYFNIHLEADDMDSIGGFMYANIQFPPHIGQSVIYEQENECFIFTITEMDQLRITSVGVKRCTNDLRINSPLR